MKRNKNELRNPFNQPVRLATDRVLSLVALAVGVAGLALHTGPAVVAVGLLAVAMGVAGLVCGTW